METPREQRYVLSNVKDCIRFWNREGKDVYDDNRSEDGKLGDKETRAYASKTAFDDWMLEMVSIDCRTFCKGSNKNQDELKFESGRTRSHVWLHVDDDRKIMIYFDKSENILKFEE
jgi:hypothetical protein